MSRRRASDITELRSGVLSLFSSKKRSLLQKESYELSPMYWKCCRDMKTNTVFLLGYRSEQSRNSGKHRLHIPVNGCTKELLPPILRAQNDEEVGSNYLCIQTDDDKLMFLKAEGNLQRDKWYSSLMDALGVKRPEKTHAASTSDLTSAGFTIAAQNMVVIEESEISGSDTSEKPLPKRRHELVYHEPYHDLESMRGLNSTDDDANSWSCPRLTSSRVDLSATSEIATDESSSSNRDMDEDGYIFPIKAQKPTLEESVSDAENSGSGSPPRKPTALNSPITTRSDRDAFRCELRDLTLTKKPAPDDSGLAQKGSSSPQRKFNNKPLPGPPTKAKETKPEKAPEPSKTGSIKSAKKPLKLPPPIPAGGNQKPRAVNKQDFPAPPQPLRPRLGNPPAPPPPAPTSGKPTANIGNEIYSLVKSFRSNQMSPDTKAVEIAGELLKENSLTFVTIQNKVYIGELGVEVAKCDLFIGDEVQRVNEQAVTTTESALQYLQSADGDSVSLYIKKIPYGVMSYISRPLETTLTLDKLGLTLAGNEVTHISSEGLVARSGIPSRQQTPGITNDGQQGNWALTQINMTPVSAGLATAEVERKLADAGNMVALVFQPVDFANALGARETT